MKYIKYLVMVVFIILLLSTSVAYGANAVPEKILDARNSLVRVLNYDGDDIYVGTGFAVGDESPAKYIVTNWHVVEGTKNRIEVMYGDNIYRDVEIVKKNKNSDLCIIKLNTTISSLKPLAIAEKNSIKAGGAIYALGFPSAADYLTDEFNAQADNSTITDGIISSIKNGSFLQDGINVEYIQINAALNPGNSGGPLLNENGQVVGINTFGMTDTQNINVAISINELTPMLDSCGIGYSYSTNATTNVGALSLVWVIAICLGLIIVVSLFFIWFFVWRKRVCKRKKSYSFYEYFGNSSNTLEEKLYIIQTIVQKVIGIFEKGNYNLNICPDNISIKGNQGILKLKKPSKQTNTITNYPGYFAPELYESNQVKGPWTDVYALSAILYEIINNKPLPPAFSRTNEEEDLFGVDFDDKYNELIELIRNGLNLNYQQRDVKLDELYKTLSSIAHTKITPAPTIKPERKEKLIKIKKPKIKWSNKKKAIVITSIALSSIMVIAAGLFVFTVSSYNQAVEYTETGNYTDAERSMSYVWISNNDTENLNKYIEARIFLSEKKFEESQTLFISLGSFIDSTAMINEVDYQNALYLLSQGNYDSAKILFQKISDYKDSKDMVLESEYLRAIDLLDKGHIDEAKSILKELDKHGFQGTISLKEVEYALALNMIEKNDWIKAFETLSNIHPYQDTGVLLDSLGEEIFSRAVSELDQQHLYTARELFEVLEDQYLVGDYLELIDALLKVKYSSKDFHITREDFNTIIRLKHLTDITPYLNDRYMKEYLYE